MKNKTNQHAGKTINGLTLIEEVRRDKSNNPYYKVKCHCRKEFETRLHHIKNGRKLSCGCLKIYSKDSPVYHVWTGMKARCLNPNHPNYKGYGGRGIMVYNAWLKFQAFQDWCFNNGFAPGLQLDRRNNDGNYEPNNCQFVTRKENCSNCRSNVFVLLDGEIVTSAEANRRLGKSHGYVHRIVAGTRKNKFFPRLVVDQDYINFVITTAKV